MIWIYITLGELGNDLGLIFFFKFNNTLKECQSQIQIFVTEADVMKNKLLWDVGVEKLTQINPKQRDKSSVFLVTMWCVSHSVVSDSCDPMVCSPPGSCVHGILQARILEWVVISFSRGSMTWVGHLSWEFPVEHPGWPPPWRAYQGLCADLIPVFLYGNVLRVVARCGCLDNTVVILPRRVSGTFRKRERSWWSHPQRAPLECRAHLGIPERVLCPWGRTDSVWFLVCVFSHVQVFVTSWTVAHQAPLSMEFSR